MTAPSAMRLIATAAIASLAAAPVTARVVNSSSTVVELAYEAIVAAKPADAYAAAADPARWWNASHTYSGDAANLTLDAKAGGCWCEKLPDGGSVEHGRVLLAWPAQGTLRISAALGPLQSSPVAGVLTWDIKPSAQGSTLKLTYAVAGHIPGGADEVAPLVDKVIAEQFERLKNLLSR